jgi:sulfate permease, SulP family
VNATLPFKRWLTQWRQPAIWRADLLAGLTGAIVVLPQGMAFATVAGMPPEYGLDCAMVPCIVATLFGSSRLMVTGPATAVWLAKTPAAAATQLPLTAYRLPLVEPVS